MATPAQGALQITQLCVRLLACACAYPVRLPCVIMASSTRASKQSLSRGGPLSTEEKSACAHMIARAVDNRQLVEILDMAVMAAPPSICKEINSLASMCSGWNQMMEAADVPIMTFESPKRTRSPEGGLSEYLVVKGLHPRRLPQRPGRSRIQ